MARTLNILRLLPVVLLLLTPLLAGSCKDSNVSPMYRVIADSDFEIGVTFGMVASQVHEQLGLPAGEETHQGGVNVEEFYLPPEQTVRTETTAELSLNYVNDVLVRVDNRYHPEIEDSLPPPFYIVPVPGVKLGLRRSAFVDALGNSEQGPAGELWRFQGEDGSTITIRATFTDIETLGDSLCSRLVVVHTGPIEAPRGEELEKRAKKKTK